MFWSQVYDSKSYFTCGIIDDNDSMDCYTLGKLLFWTLLHYGLWPQWLHKMHLQYFMEEKIEFANILKENSPIIYRIYRQLMAKSSDSNKLLHDWVQNREINVSIILIFF
jgi:hypothetical protein